MRIFTPLYLLLLILCSSSLFAQDYGMALRQSREQGFLFINMDGEKLFNLPPGHDPTVREKKEPFKLGNFYYIDFTHNVVPVRNGEHHYLINRAGEKLHDLSDSLNWVSKYQGGYFRAYERYEGRRNASIIVYLDKNGNECFGGTRYWEASPFKNGAAVVQTEDGDGTWFIIDSLGQEVINLSDSIPGDIRTYAETRRGFWKLSVKHENRMKSVYVRQDGKFSTQETDLLPSDYQPPKMSDLPDTGLDVDDRILDRINKMPAFIWPPFYQNETYGYYLFEDKMPNSIEQRMVLYDHHYNTVTLPAEEGMTYRLLEFKGRYLLVQKQSENDTKSYVFVDTKDLGFGYEVEDVPHSARVDGDLLFYETRQSFGFVTVHKIVKLSGEVIYEPAIENTIFKDFEAALAYPDQVKELHLDGFILMDLYQIPKLQNLEVLKIKNGFGNRVSMPAFGQLEHFRSLSLTDCKDLASFPIDLHEASNLQTIFISDCPALRGLEELIPKLPALTLVRSDYNFIPEKLAALKAAYPNVVFEFLLVEVPERKE